MLPDTPKSYDDLVSRFKWQIPTHFNIGIACSDAIAARSPDKPAILDYSGAELVEMSFSALADQSTRFAAALTQHGIGRGERIAIMLPQGSAAVIAHLGAYKAGAIAVPLATQFGPEALLNRLQKAGAKAFVADAVGLSRLSGIRQSLPALELTIASEESADADFQMSDLVQSDISSFQPVRTAPDDPAMMLFTSGTTGQPKGALHGHRVLLGHLPGIQMAQGFMPQEGDVFWTPSDWAWAGGLLNALLPALYFGVPVVAARAPKFEANWAIELIKKARIRNVFMPATAIKLMQSALENNPSINLRSLASAGEPLGAQTLEWAQKTLGLKINEFYGQTECNAIISACHQVDVFQSGSMGKQVPGHQVVILGDDGQVLPASQIGEIAIHKSSPVMFLEYWNDAAATAQKFSGDYMLTGDRARLDKDGYFHFVGRSDDIITSAGYRIGPSEIEDCLTAHPAVQLAAVIGKPDLTRTEIVCAHIKLMDGFAASNTLKNEIRTFVKTKLSAHEYPREINFVDEVPLTESGKVIRRHFRS